VATLAEGQLFGHEKGAFTGAVGTSLGAFRAADGGIVFLDEIGEMPLELQPKLLHVLQRLEVTPVGSSRTYAVDVQVIAATNRNLDQAVAAGLFREDLLYRLNTIHISVPPLRARKEDIPRFISHFSAHFARKYDCRQWWPAADTLDRLVGHPWPGNVRQLAQTIQRIYVFHDRETAILEELFHAAPAGTMPDGLPPVSEPPVAGSPPFAVPPPVAPSAAPEPVLPVFNLDELRRLAVRQALAAVNGHRGRAAELLGVSLNTMTRLVAAACPDIQAPPQGRKPAAKPK
jgi:transcriptional regulator with GAF, ATPase, and Fis domain